MVLLLQISSFVALSDLLSLVIAQEGSGTSIPSSGGGYSCPSTCAAPACVCASTSIPGGLSTSKTPQFVTITWDDAIQVNQEQIVQGIMNSTVNQNGCTLRSTYFTSILYTEWQQALKNYWSGNEIAAHTINHLDLVTNSAQAAGEISGSRTVISNNGIPSSAVTGFRHPFLSFNKASFDAAFASGVTYDSSVTVDPITQGYWPFTLDYGMPFDPQPCVNCPPGKQFVYPGKWEIPMYNLVDPTGALYASMDPSILVTNPATQAPYDTVLTNLKYSFQLHYAKKLPFGFYQHSAQYIVQSADNNALRVKMMTDFINWTMTTYPDVWYVTNQQLIQWTKSPVPIDQMQAKFPCITSPIDKSDPEICDGIDNDGDGIVDNGLTDSCNFDALGSWVSCYGCPSALPSVSNPSPSKTGIGASRALIPSAGCSALQSYDPVAAKCIDMKRAQPLSRALQNLPGSAGVASGKSSASSVGSSLSGFFICVAALFV